MINNTLKFILVGERISETSLRQNFEELISQLATFSDIGFHRTSDSAISISYTGMPSRATLEIPALKIRKESDLLPPQQMIFTCQKEDHLGLNLIRNVVGSIGFRVINPALGCFLPQDSQLIDITTLELGPDIARIFKKAGFKPLFNFQNSLTFYAQSLKDGTIHLINKHLLEYLLKYPHMKLPRPDGRGIFSPRFVGSEIPPKRTTLRSNPRANALGVSRRGINKIPAGFSLIVASDIARFVALQDRGLIPVSFYKYYHSPTKMINLSGFNIDKLESAVLIIPLLFELNPLKQTFQQKHVSLKMDRVDKAGSLEKYLDKLLKDMHLPSYLAVKIAADINFDKDKASDNLLPRLSVSIFLGE